MVSSAGVRFLSLRRALNLVTSWCVTVFVPNLVSGTIDINPGPVPLFSHPHGIFRHQSATIGAHRGQAGVSTGVLIRTGSSSSSRTRFASGLVLRNGAWDYVIDNASRFRAGGLLPSGVIIPFGDHCVFVVAIPEVFPREVRVFSELTDPLPIGLEVVGAEGTTPHIRAEVMMAGASSHHSSASASRAARVAAGQAGPSNPPDVLRTPVELNTDPVTALAELEKTRVALAEQRDRMEADKRRLEATVREYNAAHNVKQRTIPPQVVEELRVVGREVGRELGGDQQPAASTVLAPPIAYSTPVKNLRAAEQIARELENLEGEELRERTRRMRDLLTAASQQQRVATELQGPTASGSARATAGANPTNAPGRQQQRQTSSPHGSAQRVRAESRKNQGAAGGSRREEPAVNSRRPEPPAAASVRPAVSLRLGPREIGENDARHRIEQLQLDNQAKDDVPAGPTCFGPRIRQEQFPKGFTLPRDTPKYNGSVKPEDWLVDYMTAVGIVGGVKRVAVRYAPLMLQGSARSRLNSLPPNSINCCNDFDDAFVRNFTGTYERPGLPRHLALCVQGKDEPLRDDLQRWIKLRNTCEGVHEIQAIQYFTDGCLDGSLLKHKLLRKEIKSLADLMRIANSFAASDAAMRPIKLSPSGFIQGQQPSGQQQSAEAGGTNGPNRRERREMQRNNNFGNKNDDNTPNFNNSNTGFNKRKAEQPDAQYGNWCW